MFSLQIDTSTACEAVRAVPFESDSGDGLNPGHWRAAVQPLAETRERLPLTAGQYLDAAVGTIDRITANPKPVRLLTCRLAEPDTLDASFHTKFKALMHGYCVH